ncbi:RHS repeat domain-containing protein, partial [Pseudomonas psychrophila]|uniref:RHS repeat domain-containing protein n=1 Tax=Pseudomonas psychrophila TaxID=122355 RepID=UPI0003600F22
MIPIILGSMYLSISATQPDLKEVLNELTHCLEGYRDHADAWYGGMLDVEQQFRVGNEVITRDKDSRAPVVFYAQCQRDAKLTLVHAFEAARFVPIGNTRVRLVPEGGGPEIDTFIDASGIKRVEGCLPNQKYQITFYPQITPEQIDAFYDSYKTVLNDLSSWLGTQWDTEYLSRWQAHQQADVLGRFSMEIHAQWDGLINALLAVWDDITGFFTLISHPQENYEKLKKFLTEEQFNLLLNASQESLETALLIASDELMMWCYFSAMIAWLKLLPPPIRSEIQAQLTSGVLIAIVLAVVTRGISPAIRLALKGANKAVEATKAMALLEDFVELLMRTSKARSAPHAVAGKPILLQGEGRLNSGLKADLDIKPQNELGAAKSIPDGTVLARSKPQAKTSLELVQHVDDAPAQSRTPNDHAAESAKDTQTNGCPVSMVTGEELLTLTDGVLDGALPLEWTRLYRTSAVDINGDLGFGWSHTLSHRLQRDGDELLWTDHENRQTRFPQPSAQRPAITNSLAKAAIYLGDKDELILAQAGKNSRFYHFKDLQLSAISDAYGNRLKITYKDGRLHRIDNGAHRALLLRYAHGRLCAVDYQQYDESREFAERSNDHHAKHRVHLERWTTLHTQVTYRYNDAGQLISASNALQETEHYRYDAQHVIQERQLAGGAAFYWQWQHAGKQARCIRHWANFGQMDATYEWDDNGAVTVKNRDGSQQIYVHDDNARLVRQIDPDGAEHHKAYDDKGRLIAEKDPLGAVTEYQYNEAGQLTALIP